MLTWFELEVVCCPAPDHLTVMIKKCDSVDGMAKAFPILDDELDNRWADLRKEVRVVVPGLNDSPAQEATLCARIAPLFGIVVRSASHGGLIGGHHFMGVSILPRLPRVNPNDAMAKTANLVQLVAHENYGAPAARHVSHLAQAFLLEIDVSHSKYFVDQQNLWLQVRGHRKR